MELSIRTHRVLSRAFKAFTIDPRDVDARRAYLEEGIVAFDEILPGYFINGILMSNLAELAMEAGDYTRALDDATRAVEFYHRPGSGFGYIWALNAAGAASLALGAASEARGYAGELLSVARRIGSAPGVGMALLLLGATEAASGDARTAAGLLGAWETSAGPIDMPAGPTAYLYAHGAALLRDRLDEASVAAGIATGRRWSLDEALAAAARIVEQRPAALAAE